MTLCVRAWVNVPSFVHAGVRVRACAFSRVALIIQHAKRMRHIFRGLCLRHMFRHYLMKGTIFGERY
jgi:hypothetical protein